MGFPFTRESRVWEWTRASGAGVEVKQYNRFGQLDPPAASQGVLFDINLGILIDRYLNQETTNSGDNGGSSFTRVGGIWNYRLSLGFPAALIGDAELAPHRAYAQQLLASSRYVWMRFFMGAPEFWIAESRQVRSFVGNRSLLGEIEQRVEMNKVVGLNIAGQGSSLLRAMLDNDQVHP